MLYAGRRLSLLLLAAVLGCASGCFGVSQNPSYFPHLLPFGDIIPTHGKPPGPSYYSNFDPHSIRLVVERLESTSQVRTQHVLLATVYDEANVPRRNRRVEWKVEGVGQILEVDESGVFPGRGYEFGKYAVSYTNWHEHRISRGSARLEDDFMVRPGQTWCVLSSPVEGDTHVTVYAPGVYEWDKRVVHATIRWVDATWEFPPPAQVRFGAEHVFTTRVFRFTDRQPLERYEVRYKILDGPSAVLLPSGTQEQTVRTDVSGNANVRIRQVAPAAGTNRVSVEIIRPPDPTTPSGAGLVIATGETRIDWLAPNVALSHTGPAMVGLNQEATYTTTLANAGTLESQAITVTNIIPDGMEVVGSQPPGVRDGNNLVWTLGKLPSGQTYTIQATYRARKPGPVTSVATMITGEQQQDRKEVVTLVTVPGLKVDVQAPATAVVNVPITYQITLTNTGDGPLDNILLEAEFDPGLEHTEKAQKLTTPVAGLASKQSRNEVLVLTPRRTGQFKTDVTAKAAGLIDSKRHFVTVQEPKMALNVIKAPQQLAVARPGEWQFRIVNDGDTPLTNLVVRDRLPPELTFTEASDNGQFVAGEVTWNLGTLEPRKERIVGLKATTQKMSPAAVQAVTATADAGLQRDAQVPLKIFGVGALNANLNTQGANQLQVDQVGQYQFELVNPGSDAVGQVVVKVSATPELKLTRGAAPGGEPGQVTDREITFAKPLTLAPGERVTFVFEARGMQAGTGRLVIETMSNLSGPALQNGQPITVVAPLPPAEAPMVPPPPNGGNPMKLPKS
jgi:uncharacterized repeat protein (TIGR01451 family)